MCYVNTYFACVALRWCPRFKISESNSYSAQELKRFPSLQVDIAAAANDALEKFREDGRKTVIRLVEMESSYLTVEFFRKLPLEGEKGNNPAAPTMDRYGDSHLRRIGMCWIMSVFVLCSEKI